MDNEKFVEVLKERLSSRVKEIALIEQEIKDIRAYINLLDGEDNATIKSLLSMHSEEVLKENANRGELSPSTATDMTPEHVVPQPVGPTDGIRIIFDEDPDRKWTPIELSREVGKRIEKGLIHTNAKSQGKDFLHNILRNLVRQGFIDKNQPYRGSRQSWYIKKSTTQEP